MKRYRLTIIIIFSVLAAILLVYFFFSDDEKRYQWYENYRTSSDQPYGILFIKKMLENYRDGDFTFNDRKPVKLLLDEDKFKENTSYVFIGQIPFYDQADVHAIKKFLESGNDVFISGNEVPEELIRSVYDKECGADIVMNRSISREVKFNFFHGQLQTDDGYRFVYRFGSEDQTYPWNYFNNMIFCEASKEITPLGYHDTLKVNFIKIRAGKGHLYLHSNPIVFTNYFLVKNKNLSYASSVFSHLKGNRIVWDEYSKLPTLNRNNPYSSPLYYILQQPALKYAWWLLLTTVLLYVLFAARRKQRVIPVIEQKTNTSLEFVNLIATLHYRNGNHLDMARKKMKFFLYFIRSRYGIHADRFRTDHITRLAGKSKVEITDVRSIFDQYYLIEERFNSNIEANRLINLYYAIENFYKHCK